MAKVRMSKGKFIGINSVADDNGVIAALAIDQRGSLQKAIAKVKGSPAGDDDLRQFKMLISEVLTQYASAILLDPEYGLEAIPLRARQAGVLLAYEKTGYDAAVKGRLPDLLPEWSVRRLVQAGANVIKLLLYYDPDDEPRINSIKQAFIERVGGECREKGFIGRCRRLGTAHEVFGLKVAAPVGAHVRRIGGRARRRGPRVVCHAVVPDIGAQVVV